MSATIIMLRPRIIPYLLVHRHGLVKTVQFADPKYVGDPLNAVRIFNDKRVDELAVLDIDATVEARAPDYSLIRNLASECRMPLCYGGGIHTVEHAKRVIGLGVEKVALSTALVEGPGLASELARELGSQSVVAVLDVKRVGRRGRPRVFLRNGKKKTRISPAALASRLSETGVGEIVINSIDRDGTMSGYDLDLVEEIHDCISVPLTALGGAGSLKDLEKLVARFGIIGAGAGSLFVFKGPYRAVLISYPNPEERRRIASVGPL